VSPLKRKHEDTKKLYQIGSMFTTAYELADKILVGKGSYGKVYKVRLAGVETSPDLVIKLMCIDVRDICDIRRMLREALVLLAATKNASGLVQLCDAFWCQTRNHIQLALVMPRYDYSLYDVIRCSEPLDERAVRRLMWQVACAIADCHAAGLLYGDLKSSNVLVNKDCTTALADFSLTVGIPMPAAEVGMLRMTRYYRPMEITLQLPFSLLTDVWALGCLFIELLQLLQPRKNRRVFAITPVDDEPEGQLDSIIRMIGAPAPGSSSLVWLEQIDPDLAAQALRHTGAPELPMLVADSVGALELIERMLVLEPHRRISIYNVLAHPYFAVQGLTPWKCCLPAVDLRAAENITCATSAAQEFARVVSEIQKTTSGPSLQDSPGHPTYL